MKTQNRVGRGIAVSLTLSLDMWGGGSTQCLSRIFSMKLSHYTLYKRVGGARGRSGVQRDNRNSHLSKFERTNYESVRVAYVTRLPSAAENVRDYYLGQKRPKSSMSNL